MYLSKGVTNLDALDGQIHYSECDTQDANTSGYTLMNRKYTSNHQQQADFCGKRGGDIYYCGKIEPLKYLVRIEKAKIW